MKQKLFTLLLAVVTSVGTMFAWDYEHVLIGDLYYNLTTENQTAEVSHNTNIIIANIPSSVEYNSVTYSVTSIGSAAFRFCSSLTSVTIPNSVTSIGGWAFSCCSGLTAIKIPNSVTSIGPNAFEGCGNLPIFNNIRYADTYMIEAVDKTQSTYTIKTGTKWIGRIAFMGCTAMSSISIPNSVTSIQEQAFSGCSGLISVIFGNNVTSIEYKAFDQCTGLTSVTIPNSVTSIGDYAFSHCSGLTSVTIPNSVTSIGSGAFAGCTGLTAPVYNAHIFAYLPTSFTGTYTIPDGIESIVGVAFSGCTGLTAVTIPNSVTRIGWAAFSNCSSLTAVTIPYSVTSIRSQAFSGCTCLTSIIIDRGNTIYDSRNNCNAIIETATNTLIAGCQNTIIPNSVTSIGSYAFSNCSSLTAVTIPNSVTSIGEYAFYYCSNLTSVTCFAKTPPKLSFSFDDICKYIPLYVPAESINAYKSEYQWENFANILPISAQETETTSVQIEPRDNSVSISWPQVDEATTYTIEIKKYEEMEYTLTFDEEGHLISMSYAAPSRDNSPQQTQAAGFAFTVTGLDSGTTYNYTMTAEGNGGNVLKTESGTFTTTGDAQGFEEVPSDLVRGTKVLHNGQIFILRGEKEYTLTGQEVK